MENIFRSRARWETFFPSRTRDQVATVGYWEIAPNLVDVVADAVAITVDLRNTDEARLQEAEAMLHGFVATTAAGRDLSDVGAPGRWVAAAKAGMEEICELLAQSCIIAPTGVTYACDLDRTRKIKEHIFNFALHREPEACRLIIATKGPVPPA